VLLESYNLLAITETWWDESHDRSGAINGYRLFRRDRRGRRSGSVALYIEKWIECEELSLKNSHKGTLRLMSTIGHLIKETLLIKPSYSSYRRHCARRLWSRWGTSITLTSAGKISL